MPHSPNAAPAPLSTAVLLLIFNRPATTRRVFEAVRRARPPRLYVAADGPRTAYPADADRCTEARAIVAAVDWPCQVFTLFRATNLNCGVGPASAIDWFFRQEEAGIILEDDCVPHPTFFRFCEELLTRYRADTRVMHIGGNNFSREARRPQPAGAESYYFSNQVNSWGWATWRRAWQHFDFLLTDFQRLRDEGQLDGFYSSRLENRYRLGKIAGVLDLPSPPHVWDYQWHFAIVANSGLCVVPAVNLVGNIGFGDEGTHTLDATDEFADVPTRELAFPLRHPDFVLVDRRRDRQRFREFLLGRVVAKFRRSLRRSSAPLPSPLEVVPTAAPAHSHTQLA